LRELKIIEKLLKQFQKKCLILLTHGLIRGLIRKTNYLPNRFNGLQINSHNGLNI